MKPLFTLFTLSLTIALAAGCSGRDTRGSDDDNGGDSDTDTETEYDGPPVPTTCEEAGEALTSVGCDFVMADMDNWDDVDPLDYAVVVSNPHNGQDAAIAIEDGNGVVLVEQALAPGELQVFDVACQAGCLAPPAQVNVQGLAPRSAFRLTSDIPVTAYQWNPYGEEIYTTDSSLLIPVTSLSSTYIAASWQSSTDNTDMNTSQIMIVGTAENTSVTVTPTAEVSAYGGIGPLAAGQESSPFELNAADVLTIRAAALNADLTGTAIQANNTIVVFGGNSCGNVPDVAFCCCDHVEEQLLPLEAWGTATVLGRAAPRSTCTETADTTLWRIIAGADGMTLYFDPPYPQGDTHHFDQQGEYIEFQSATDHHVEGVLDDPPSADEAGAPFFAYQMMNGALYANCGPAADEGDPMMLLSPPAGQYLDKYVFNTDNVFDFDYDHIIVVRSAGVAVDLDCAGTLDDALFTAAGTSGWEVGRFFIDDPTNSTGCLDGAHAISSTEPFGLSVVGTASYQSYGYLGGVGVRSINPKPVIE
jgi:hypothetical protein